MNLSLPQASTNAGETDALLAGLCLISLAVLVLVFGLMLVFVVRYRATNTLDRGAVDEKSWKIEIGWTAATLAAFFGLFLWGADLYVRLVQPPPDALRVYVIGKQWMWKVEHPGGQKEIDQLHVPVGRDIQLIMTSEDVLHDFSVPAFRVKHDVLPGRYTQLWFHPRRTGNFALYCTQFCGTDHSAMIGRVVVMDDAAFDDWLDRTPAPSALVAQGAMLFQTHGCSGCHAVGISGSPAGYAGSTLAAPALNGLYGRTVRLDDGTQLIADDTYLRRAILYPDRLRVAGYRPLMPSFAGQLDEAQLIRLIAYLQSLQG